MNALTLKLARQLRHHLSFPHHHVSISIGDNSLPTLPEETHPVTNNTLTPTQARPEELVGDLNKGLGELKSATAPAEIAQLG